MGNLYSAIAQNFPPKTTWDADQIPDLTSKVTIVTGGNSGLGKEIIKALLAHNAKVYMACRNEQKANAAIHEIHKETGKTALFLPLDLASLDSVKNAAQEFRRQESQLHVLFNNGGIMSPPIEELTKEGYDLQFGVGVIGHFYLTTLLLPELKAAAKSSPDHVSRVINTSSLMHLFYPKVNYGIMRDTSARNKAESDLYAHSTFGKIVFSNELARRYGDDSIMSLSLHPGIVRTELGRTLPPLGRRLLHALSYPPALGVSTPLWGGTSPEAASLNGKYLIPWARIGAPHKATLDPKIGAELWEWLESEIRDYEK